MTNSIYFQLDNKSFTKPTWNEFTNKVFNYIKNNKEYPHRWPYDEAIGFHYSEYYKEEYFNKYKEATDIKFIGFIPIEEFEYYLLAD